MLAELILKIAAQDQRQNGKFYPRPSSAGPERCKRSMVYHALGFKRQPFPGRAIIIFSDSSFHEDLTLDWLRKSSFQVHSEQMDVVCRPPMKKGSIDGIVTDLLGTDRLLEHKAINHFTFQKYWSGELPLDYFTQTAIYADGIQQELNPDLKEAILLIKNKNTAQYMEFLCHYEFDTLTIISKTLSTGETEKMDHPIEGIVQEACDKFDSVLDYAKRKTLPKRPYFITDWQCEYCGWYRVCWRNYSDEFNEMKTDEEFPQDIADKVAYYKELGAQKKEITDEYDELREGVKKTMRDAEIRQGRAGDYILRLSLSEREYIDPTKLTEKEKEKATKKKFIERLTISKPKQPKRKEGA
jgi:hypothetical protein